MKKCNVCETQDNSCYDRTYHYKVSTHPTVESDKIAVRVNLDEKYIGEATVM